MAAYLPKDNSPGSAFAEGGGLYALGEYWSLSCKVNHINSVIRWEFLTLQKHNILKSGPEVVHFLCST